MSRFLRSVKYVLDNDLKEAEAIRYLKRTGATEDQIESFRTENSFKKLKERTEKKAKKV